MSFYVIFMLSLSRARVLFSQAMDFPSLMMFRRPLVPDDHRCIIDRMNSSSDRDALHGHIAVVAGATRGAGRGIAAALGEAGATVICTGRTSRTGALQSDYDRAETIEETAEVVTQLGGTGIAIAVDHLDSAQVKALAERIRNDHG